MKTNSHDSLVLAVTDRKLEEEEDEEIVCIVCELLSQHRLDFNKNHEIQSEGYLSQHWNSSPTLWRKQKTLC